MKASVQTLLALLLLNCFFLTPAWSQGTVFWADDVVGVMKADLGTGTNELVLPQVADVDGGAITSMDGSKISWTSGRTTLVSDDGTFTSFTVDIGELHRIPGTDTLVFSDVFEDKVYTSNADGSSLNEIATGINLITLTPDTSKIYYTESNNLKRMNLDGSGIETLNLGGFNTANTIDSIAVPDTGSTFFWLDGNDNKIQTGNKDGSGAVTDLLTSLDAAKSLVEGGGFLYWIENKDIMRAALDGSGVTTIATAGDPNGLILDEASNPDRLIWFDRQDCAIETAAADGTGSVSTLLTSICAPTHLTIDYYNNKIYVSNTTFGKNIQSLDLDGSNVQILIDSTNTLQPEEIAVDAPANMFYWVDSSLDRVISAGLDGSSPTIRVNSSGGLEGIALDGFTGVTGQTASSIFYSRRDNGAIASAARDGSNPQDILTGLNFPAEMTVDPTGGKVYFVNRGDSEIARTNFDGSGGKETVIGSVSSIGGIRLDPALAMVYWTTNSSPTMLKRVNVDGTGSEDVFSLSDRPIGFDLFWDADNDGTADQVDECDSDPNKSLEGDCGCGTPDTDANNNNVSDCLTKDDYAATITLLETKLKAAKAKDIKADPTIQTELADLATALLDSIQQNGKTVTKKKGKARRFARALSKAIRAMAKAKGKKFKKRKRAATKRVRQIKRLQAK